MAADYIKHAASCDNLFRARCAFGEIEARNGGAPNTTVRMGRRSGSSNPVEPLNRDVQLSSAQGHGGVAAVAMPFANISASLFAVPSTWNP
jgi:hypothetical protein